MNKQIRQRVAEHRADLELLLPTGQNTVEAHFSAMFSDINKLLKKWTQIVVDGKTKDIIPEEKKLMQYYFDTINTRMNELQKKYR